MKSILSLVVVFIGVVAVILGVVFVGLGVSKGNLLTEAMRVEQVRLSIYPEGEPALIDSASEAQAAGDLIREHRRSIAPSYQDLLGEGKFDPTNPVQLTYAQALNMENYLYLAVVAFGLTQAVMASGVFMVITGVALGSTGVVLFQLRKTP